MTNSASDCGSAPSTPIPPGLTARRLYVTLGTISSLLVIVGVASAAVKPWMWSQPKANRMMVWNNPQGIGVRGDRTTILRADCKGTGAYVKADGVKLFHVFRCGLTFRDDDTGDIWTPAEFAAAAGMPKPPVYMMCSSKTSPNRTVKYGLGVPGCP